MAIAHRASIFHCVGDPDIVPEEQAYEYFPDGILLVDDGKVQSLGHASDILPGLGVDVELFEHRNCLITPGFVDTHIHYPQTEVIAASGEQLIDWLERYTYPCERKFADENYARDIAEFFLDELLRAGTTTALVFGTVHKESVEAFFKACEVRNLRMIAGKVMMDRNAPDYLIDSAETSYLDSKVLIEKWHNRGRLRYALCPRFAVTSTAQQLGEAGQLLREYPGVYLHAHMAESIEEVRWVEKLFPERNNYLDTYDHAGLLGRRSILAHCNHLSEQEWCRLEESQTAIAFCPTSNLFLGSGLFQLNRAVSHNINVGMGTDVGAGSSFSMLQTLNEAYKVMQLQGEQLSPLKSFYLATLGGATTLDMSDIIGNFVTGKEADFLVLDKSCTPLMQFRMEKCESLFEELFVFCILGDDRAIKQTWSGGTLLHQRDRN